MRWGRIRPRIAHLGVLRVLEEEHIGQFHCRDSAGAMLAIAYASGHPIHEIRGAGESHAIKDRPIGSFPGWALPPIKSSRTIRAKFLGVSTFENCGSPGDRRNRPEHGEPIYFTSGPLGPALRASCAYPGMFVPVEFEGRTLVDGFLAASRPGGCFCATWGRRGHRRVLEAANIGSPRASWM